jgi:hypothetical protein
MRIQDRAWRFKKFKNCFVGDQAVDWLLEYVDHLRSIQPQAKGVGACREEWTKCSACQAHKKWVIGRKRGRTARKVDAVADESAVETGEADTAAGAVADARGTEPSAGVEDDESTRASRLPEYVRSRDDAVRVLNTLVAGGLIEHVVDEHAFKDAKYFFRFTSTVAGLVLDPDEAKRKDSAGGAGVSGGIGGGAVRSSSVDRVLDSQGDRANADGGAKEAEGELGAAADGEAKAKPKVPEELKEQQEQQPRFDEILFPTVVQLAARHQQIMIAELPEFQNFCLATTELQVIDLSTLADERAAHDECTAFWLNLYNCLALHAFFSLKPTGSASVVEQYRFFKVGTALVSPASLSPLAEF